MHAYCMHICIKYDNLYMQADPFMRKQYSDWVAEGCPDGIRRGDPIYLLPKADRRSEWFQAGVAAGKYQPSQEQTFNRSVNRFRGLMIRHQAAANFRARGKARAGRFMARAKAKAQAKAEA